MKKIILILIFCIILLGCKRTTTEPTYVDYKTGTYSLEIDFITGQPPDEIWQGSEIIVGVDLRNKGGYPLEEGELRLIYDSQYFEMFNIPNRLELLEGKSQFYPDGERYMESYSGKNIKDIPFGKEKYNALFELIACYPYKTEAVIDICLNPAEFDYLELDQDACKASRVFSLKSQGSPLVITRIEEIIQPIDEIDYKVNFVIDVENRGDGKVRDRDSYYKECRGKEQLEQKEIDIVDITEVSFSDFSTMAGGTQRIDCGPNMQVKLEKNKAQIFCSAVVKKSRGIFKTPLKIELDFGYTSTKQKITKIKKIKVY